VHNETLSIVAMCVSNEDYSPARIHGCNGEIYTVRYEAVNAKRAIINPHPI
jgi:hypothetical protein